MGMIIKGVKNLFIYKEPDKQPFELLEKDEEGVNQQTPIPDIEEISNQYNKDNKSGGDQKKYKRTPVKVGEIKTTADSQEKGVLSDQLLVNLEYMKQRFNLPLNQDVVIREFNMGNSGNAFLMFIDGMIDNSIINQFVIPQLSDTKNFTNYKDGNFVDYIIRNVISVNQVTKSNNLDDITVDVLRGMTALFVDGEKECILIGSIGFEKRSIDKPLTESIIQGSQEAFTEDLKTNLSLLRRSVKNENFIIEMTQVSKTNRASCAIAYLKGIANPRLLDEVKRRVNSIDTDLILGGGMLEQLIEDSTFMLFPQIMQTERPDRAASFLLEGKVLLITEGTPFVMAVPITLFHLLHSSEDSLLRWEYGTFLRLIRLIGVLTALFLPGLYIALTQYHHEMIPTQLLLSIVKSRLSVPFPVFIEILMLEISFELIREGGIRVPGVIGNTLGIVGALILGQAAVAAGFVSPALIIIVAVTGISSFVIPTYSLSLSIRILRFIVLIFGAVAGFYGVSLAIIGLALVATNMKSFGVPFLSPIAPKAVTGHDVIIRYPTWEQEKRPDATNALNQSRQGPQARGWKKSKGGDNNDKGR
ncbi:MAG: spore germination protein [Clostridiales bacterium]|nr:spore germination protein [Clostridiales bacterium]